MSNDEAVREVLLDILAVGLLRIRSAGEAGRANVCAIEADHLHNIPKVVASMNANLLAFYWDTERPAFLKAALQDVRDFVPLWDRLKRVLEGLP